MNPKKIEIGELKFLAGGGEMGERIRAFDWAHSSLGPIEHWPSALLSTLSICLNSQFPMAIYWGIEGFLLYNDAWRPILGNKHPGAVGRSAREVWPEIWEMINPLFESVRNTAQGTWRGDELLPMQRFGYTEECYFDYTFNPIKGNSGEVEGILNIVQETTFRVLNERRTRLLRELASCSGSAKTLQGACELVISAIGTDPADIPFALLYIVGARGKSARLIAGIGLSSESAARPSSVDLANNHPDRSWPLLVPFRDGKPVTVDDLAERFGSVPGGYWPEPTARAVVLPVTASGQDGVAALLVVGVSPRRKLDDGYSQFFDLVASHVASTLSSAKAYEEERNRAEALAEIDRAKTTFFGNVSHELRTPLTLILGPLEDEMRENSVPQERLELAHRNALRLLKLVNTLLDFSRIEAGRMQTAYIKTDLAAFTAELASVFRSAIEKGGLKFTVDCPPLTEPVFVDHDMWEKTVFNLLSNAFKFTLAGEINISLRADGKVAVLKVRDTGTGIAALELPHIFERFHRVRNSRSRSHEGTGIGLALVQELVRLHGGSVQVESIEGCGTTFTVSIPMGTEHLPRNYLDTSPSLTSTSTGAQAFLEESRRWLPDNPAAVTVSQGKEENKDKTILDSPKASILLADDNSDMREYIRRLLVGRGYEVIVAENGQVALETARRKPPSLVLSDVMMPQLDGFGLLRELRSDPSTRAIPIILLSARAGEEARVEGAEAGADDYLTKPFSARELLARVTTHLELARVRREALLAREKSEERTRATLDSITDGLHVVDASACITYFNAAARRILAEHGQDADTLTGRNFFEVFPNTLEVGAGRTLKRTLAERVPTESESFYTPWQRWFNVRHYPTAEGGVSTFFQDITERKLAEDALHEANALLADKAAHLEALVQQRTVKLSETIGELEAFSYSIAHDMRAPLRSLQGFSGILVADYGGKLDAECQRYLRLISAAAGRMDRLIQDVLNYSRVVRGELPMQAVDMERLLRGIVDTYPKLAPDEADILLEGPFPPVLGNEAMLTQIFSNLMGNAVKFVADGVKPRIRVWAEPRALQVRFFVQDNGIGIAPDQHEKIFGIFQRVNKSYEGTGIGLSIVKKAVERMRGTLGLQSEPGRGSTFWIEMPQPESGKLST